MKIMKTTKQIVLTYGNRFIVAFGYSPSDKQQAETDMLKYLEGHVNNNTEFECYDFADIFWTEYTDKGKENFYAELIKYKPIDDEIKFEIVMGRTIEDYTNGHELYDYQVANAYYYALYNFDSSDFRDITNVTDDIEDFMENAEFGDKALIGGVLYFKVRNHVDNEPYVIYFTDDNELEIL